MWAIVVASLSAIGISGIVTSAFTLATPRSDVLFTSTIEAERAGAGV